MITAGLIHDLSDFTETDPNFDIDDFTLRARQGALWQKRLWLLPQFLSFNIIYVNRSAYELPEIDVAGSLGDSPAALSASGSIRKQLARSQRDWLYVDPSNDTLFVQAIAQRCAERMSSNSEGDGLVNCSDPLRSADLAAAFTWYQERVEQKHAPDLTTLSPEERAGFTQSLTSSPPRVAYWVGHPQEYERYRQLDEVQVRPLSANDESLVTPLWVYGNIISQQSSNPQAVWAWIDYLSKQTPVGGAGTLPARRSVASDWASMPTPLREVMQLSLDASRSMRIEERQYFDAKVVAAVNMQQMTPMEAAQQQIEQRWFGARHHTVR
jgi:hypothetical protein